MEISHINWLAGMGFTITCGIIAIRRLMVTPRIELESQVGWALSGGFGAAALVKASYPLYLFIRYGSIKGIDDLWLYVYGGSIAAMFAGLALIVRSFKVS
jgi:hypothetical protein